ncbi:Ig-like domain-containing protein [Methylorubrum suomiense]
MLGGAGDDVLAGDEGKDTLTGGAGADSFVFGAASATSTDRVIDFSSAAGDKLVFKAVDYGLNVGQGVDATGQLNADYLEYGAAASRSHATFVFNSLTKTLSWDADGAGGQAAVAVAIFTIPTGMAAGDFLKASDVQFVLNRSLPAPSLALRSDTGISASDGITQDGTVVAVPGSPGGSLRYTVDGVAVATYDPTALADGAHTVTVTQTDAAGNVSPTTSLSFVLDRTAPSAPSLVLGSDTGASASDGVTRDATVVVAAGEPGGSLRYTVDGVAVTTYDPTALADGTHTVAVTQTDAAGNVSPTTSLSFVLDRTAPSAPSLVLGSDTGASASDGVTRDATVVVAAGEPGGSLRYTVDGVAVTTYDPTALADGAHTVTVTQADAAGNASPTTSLSFVLDRLAPSLSISASDAQLTAGETSELTFQFSETISGFSSDSVSISHGQLGRFAKVGERTYTALFTPDSDYAGEGLVSVGGASYADSAGNTGGGGQIVFTINTVATSRIAGTAGDDMLRGTASDDRMYGDAGNDVLLGYAGNDVLYGEGGNDQLDGGTGADTMRGGIGDDTYTVENVGDVVDESDGSGAADRVLSSISFDLGNRTHVLGEVEILMLTGTAAINGTGNELSNKLGGNAAANILDGGGGNDFLYGVAGNDTLVGGAGNDRLDGGAGADLMRGGAGDDTYDVDNAGDVVDESDDPSGIDLVNSAIDYTLSTNVENLTLTGTAALHGTGNALANRLSGNGAANVLSGGDGADVLLGNAGDDVLAGDGGKDTLTGGAGADSFVFGVASADSTDRILDFNSAAGDKLVFRASDYGLGVGHGVDASGHLNADYFEYGAAASRSHATFVFNGSSKTLSWDADGAGSQAAVAVAVFTVPTGMAATDFLKAIDVDFIV